MSIECGFSAAVKDVSAEDMIEYLDYVYKPGKGWTEEQITMIGLELLRHRLFPALISAFMNWQATHETPSALVAVWSSAFQCGREFENRLMAKSMREGK